MFNRKCVNCVLFAFESSREAFDVSSSDIGAFLIVDQIVFCWIYVKFSGELSGVRAFLEVVGWISQIRPHRIAS